LLPTALVLERPVHWMSVLHELGGHYGVARSFGCSLTELRLYLFGGGWVDGFDLSYDPEQRGYLLALSGRF